MRHRFFTLFFVAVIALIIPFTVLISQQVQELRQYSQTPSAQSHTISIQEFGFVPNEISIPTGDTITWVNHNIVSHTTTSDIQATADSWDSGGLNSAQTFSVKFVNPGTYQYHCNLHPQERGTIIVGNGTQPPTPTPTVTTITPTSVYIPTPTLYCLGSNNCLPTASPVSLTPTSTVNPSSTPVLIPSDISSVPTSAPEKNKQPPSGGILDFFFRLILALLAFLLSLFGR